MAKDPIFSPLTKRSAALPADLKLPAVSGTTDTMLEFALRQRLRPEGLPEHALGRMETLVLQLARVQNGTSIEFDLLAFDSPQLVVFAADHGIADEGMSSLAPTMTEQMVMQLLRGQAPVNALADMHGFELTVVDAGMAKPIAPPSDTRQHGSLLLRKIGYGTRNLMLGPAMSTAQAVSAVHAGMDVVRHLPGNVIALGDVGVANAVSAAMLLSRLCGVPVPDAFPREDMGASSLDDTRHWQRLDKLQAALQRHALAMSPVHALCAFDRFRDLDGAVVAGVDVRQVLVLEGQATSCYLSLHDGSGEMSCAVNDMGIIEQLTPARLTPLSGFLGAARLWVLDTNLATHTRDGLFERQGEHIIFVDTVSVAKVEKIRPWLHRIHTLKPNRSEAEQLCGFTIGGPDTWPMAAAWFHRAGVQRLFLSLGDQGIFYSDGECQGHLPVLGSPVVNVTGGGDAFMAGLAHAWLLEQGIMEATRFALGCAALTVNCSDTVFSGLSKAAVERMLEEYPC